jgi:hypothetical protein
MEKYTAAVVTAGFFGDRLVDPRRQLSELAIGEENVTHWIFLLGFWQRAETAPQMTFAKLFDGFSLLPHRISWNPESFRSQNARRRQLG